MNSARAEYQNIKEFLTVYNSLTERCFQTCIPDFNRKSLSDEEIACVERCTYKSTNTNHRLMSIFSEINEQKGLENQREAAEKQRKFEEEQRLIEQQSNDVDTQRSDSASSRRSSA